MKVVWLIGYLSVTALGPFGEEAHYGGEYRKEQVTHLMVFEEQKGTKEQAPILHCRAWTK